MQTSRMAMTDAKRVQSILNPSPSPKNARKPSFFGEEDEIVVKPSTELIPDEYESVSSDISVHIFKSPSKVDENIASNVLNSFQEIHCKIDHNHVHELQTEKEIRSDLERIKKEAANKSALVLIFIGLFKTKHENGSILLVLDDISIGMKTIWNYFSANNCEELKYKPKVFLFSTSCCPELGVQTDAALHHNVEYEKAYDFPLESDILVIYHKDESIHPISKPLLFKKFSENICQFSKKYDIIDLVSCISQEDVKNPPIIISTLTRKFFLSSGKEREHFLTAFENFQDLDELIKKIAINTEKIHEYEKKKKDKKDNTLFSSLTRSFKKKPEEKPIVKKKPVSDRKGLMSAPTSPRPTISTPIRKISNDGPRRRSRVSSETESTTGKRPWRN